MDTLVSIGAVPSGVLVTLPPRAKSLAALGRRNSPKSERKVKERPICAELKNPFKITKKVDKNVGKVLDNRSGVWYSGLN